MSDLRRLDWVLAKAELAESRLTPWERQFIDNLRQRRASQGDALLVTDRQCEILEEIAEKAI